MSARMGGSGEATRVRTVALRELAELAGVDPSRVDHLAALGILSSATSPFAESDIQRIRLADALEASGVALEDLGGGIRRGTLSFEFVEAVFPHPVALSSRTLRHVVEDTGQPLELIRSIYTMWGLRIPELDEPMREDDVRFWEINARLPPEGRTDRVMTATNRLFSEGMRKVVVSCVQFFRESVEQPLRDRGAPPGETLAVLGNQANALLPFAYEIVDWGIHRFMEHALLEYFVELVEEAAEEDGITRQSHATLPAIAFLDVTGFTTLSEAQGDEEAADLAATLARLVQEAAQECRGRLVKLLGDGAMFYFDHAGQAICCGMKLVQRFPASGLPPARMGVGAGSVVSKDGDYFGRTVNLAARITNYARPGEVLFNEAVLDDTGALVDGSGDRILHQCVGPVQLKGVPGLVTLHTAVVREEPGVSGGRREGSDFA